MMVLPSCDRMNRSHEGCGQQRNRCDVVGLRLRLYDHLDAGASLERLGEVALFAPGNDVVVKGLKVAVGDDGDSEGGVRASIPGSAADGWVADGAKEGDGLLNLHGVSPFARSIGTHLPKGRERCAAPKSRHRRVAKRRSFWSGDPEPARGEESETRRARNASSECRAEGRSSCTEAVAE
jgi:hypothetical protein